MNFNEYWDRLDDAKLILDSLKHDTTNRFVMHYDIDKEKGMRPVKLAELISADGTLLLTIEDALIPLLMFLTEMQDHMIDDTEQRKPHSRYLNFLANGVIKGDDPTR